MTPIGDGGQRVGGDAVVVLVLGVHVFGADIFVDRIRFEEGSAVGHVVDEDNVRVASGFECDIFIFRLTISGSGADR